MGLDMFLTRKVYLDDYHVELKPKGNQPPLVIENPLYIIQEFGYWRKANQIHNWFVERVQDNNDDCDKYYVSKEQLQELLSTCQGVLDNPKKAEALLPTTGGFFFGSPDYDDHYLDQIKYTIEICQKALDLLNQDTYCKFYYQASW